MQIFSAPQLYAYWDQPYAYWDLRMHTMIPKWKISHRGIQDLISHMEIFSMCIRLVTKLSLYAYGCQANPCMHTGILFLAIPECIRGSRLLSVCMGISGTQMGSNLDPCSGSKHDSRKDRSYIRICSPYAYRDSPYAYGEEGK
jgi:hypothetical protein